MKLNDLTSKYETRIARVNRWLEETYGFKVYDKVGLEELYKVKADLDAQRESLKLSLPFNSYHQNSEYAKNILLSEAVVLMIGQIDDSAIEGMNADHTHSCGCDHSESCDCPSDCECGCNADQPAVTLKPSEAVESKQEVVKEQDELEQAEVILASKQLVDEMQQIIEKLGKMQNDELGAIVDQMTYQKGADTAVAFNDAVSSSLENLLSLARETKEQMNNEVLKLQGEMPASDMASADDSIDDQMDDQDDEELDLPADSDLSTDGDEASAGPEEEPLGRAKKS